MSADMKWDEMFEMFEKQYPHIAEKVMTWYPCGEFDLLIKLSDGIRILYDHFDGTVRTIFHPDPKNYQLTEDEYRREFSDKLGKMIDRRGISQQELASIAGVSKYSISKYLRRQATPSAYVVDKLARALGCSTYELMSFE